MAPICTISRRTALHLAGGALAMGVTGAAAPPSPRDRLEKALARIADPAGEGARAFLTLYADTARAAADDADARARAGSRRGPLDGAIVSIKDLFDVAGEPTRAGSRVLADAPPAAADAPIVQRLRQAGAVIIGKTNMTEFAFSGVGLNPHYGTPVNPLDRARVPGGSTSGGAVAVAVGMCEIAIGTDTGGSTRIPAALCGITGFKPTKVRVPTDGVFPLSPTLDSVGPLARTVAACAQADAVLAGEPGWTLEAASLRDVRFGIPQGMPLGDLDNVVASSFDTALKALGRAGVALSNEALPAFDAMATVNVPAPIASVEGYAIHRERLGTRGADFDQIVRARMAAGAVVTADGYAAMLRDRIALVRAMDGRLSGVDILVLPTTPIIAPLFTEVATPAGFGDRNRLLLRNTAWVNFFDLCAISLPLPWAKGVGLMLVARNGHDRRLFQIAAAVERLLAG